MTNASASETSKTRLGLRVFAIILAIVTMSIFGASWRNRAWVYYIVAGIPGIWSLINVVLIAFKRPAHPGAHIALDLIFTADLWFFGFFGLLGESMSYEKGYSRVSLRAMLIAALSLMIFNGLLHFVHFVLGCCDVHWRRHALSVDHNPRKGDIEDSV
ncbi:hypothetical protein N7517_004664 [Penicillium concentricum]|uniref:Uncharacterized protein n=1 Tax=Penicillium concentricum TaxID=293559 RepID=A0A9W9SAN4_9EURO|nr:uncharacterized protein N7517_004664 [Penicillium concentricum]KAJ5372658.1 hypothetical protein N7517_004664 [Penicillium concentricum]